jgi:hypothetical protein
MVEKIFEILSFTDQATKNATKTAQMNLNTAQAALKNKKGFTFRLQTQEFLMWKV